MVECQAVNLEVIGSSPIESAKINMNKEQYQKTILYWMLEQITNKKPRTIRTYFYRNKMNVSNKNDFINYIRKYDRSMDSKTWISGTTNKTNY